MDEHVNTLTKIQELLLPKYIDIKNYLIKSINSILDMSELDEIYSKLFCYLLTQNNDYNIILLCKNIRFKPNDTLIKIMLDIIAYSSKNEYFLQLINIVDDTYLSKNFKYVTFKYVLLFNEQITDDYIKKNINLITNEMIEYIITGCDSKMYEHLIMIGVIQPNLNHLLLACRLCKDEIVKVIILHKVIPTLECLNNLLLSLCPKQGILDMLIEVGLPLTQNNMDNIIRRRLNIKNKSYIDLVDDDIFRTCVKIDYYPAILSYFSPNIDSIHYFLRYNVSISRPFADTVPEYVLNSIKKCDLECLQIILDERIYTNEIYKPLNFVLSREIIDADFKTIKKLIYKYFSEDKHIREIIKKLN
jgi:hypothetical protein